MKKTNPNTVFTGHCWPYNIKMFHALHIISY